MDPAEIKCFDCYEHGIMRIGDQGAFSWMYCHCNAGESAKATSKWNLPRWNHSIKVQQRYPKMPFPIELFPKNDDSKPMSVLELMRYWTQELDNAAMFWELKRKDATKDKSP